MKEPMKQSSTPLDIDAILAELRKRKESPPTKQEMEAMLAELRLEIQKTEGAMFKAVLGLSAIYFAMLLAIYIVANRHE
jgi:cytochrome c-type biogenesis protein CcmH/NrfG